MSKEQSVIRLKPYEYIHVLDNNTNVTRVFIGPATFVRQDHEIVVRSQSNMIIVPPRHYCIIGNPVVRDEKGVIQKDNFGQVKNRHGDQEIRLEQEPFPLHPGESLNGTVQLLKTIQPDSALRLTALRDFLDGEIQRSAGEEWLFVGPGTYFPKVEVKVMEVVQAKIIRPNSALLLRARRSCIDKYGNERKAGEEWLIREPGAFLPSVDEVVVKTVYATVLTDTVSLWLRAKKTCVDTFNKKRLAGEEWLVSVKDTECYIADVFEEVVGEVDITTLNKQQYCVICDPIGQDGKPKLGSRLLKVGPCSFFLQPGESLENGIQSVYFLCEEEALLLSCRETFTDKNDKGEAVQRVPGDRWMTYGPKEFVPPVEVEVVEKRQLIALDENEGIYVRDVQTGKVRPEKGRSYMLSPTEELWEKKLTPVVQNILRKEGSGEFDPTRIVTFRARHNTAVQIYDYQAKEARVVFGPNLVMIHPDEQFTLLSLSGGKPKKPHAIKAIGLFLGPDFMTDIIQVETSDHARLSLQLSYNWKFDVDKENPTKLFNVPDFVGDACKAIASRVRGAVASSNFDTFHRNSAHIIRSSVFGLDDDNHVNEQFRFNTNGLVITNIDIQSVEPVDQRTRDSLQKSVQMAIEITTAAQEATAKHKAEREEQEARAKLERQVIIDKSLAESERQNLLRMQTESAAIETQGQAIAEARAQAEAEEIAVNSSVALSGAKAKASMIESNKEVDQLRKRQEADIAYQQKLYDLEIEKEEKLSQIESEKFKATVAAIGPKTIAAIARAGPETQAQLLGGLGLSTMMLTDGKSPINLFDTAGGLVQNVAAHQQSEQ